MSESHKTTSFLLILVSSFFILLIYTLVLGPRARQQNVRTQKTEIILVGDTMLGRSVMTKSLGLPNTSYPFEKVADILSNADLVFLNLENPIIENCPMTDTGMIFCTSPGMIEGLEFAGVDVVTLANNHSLNYGEKGLEETVQRLVEAGVSSTGLGRLVTKKFGVLKFGFLGLNLSSKSLNSADIALVRKSAQEVDILIVGVHWGVEYTSKPAAFQRGWAEKLVEAGADVIAGHGSHWVQDIDYIDGVPVYYSLGNFIFDQMWSEKTREGLVIKLTFKGTEIEKEELLPTYMSSWAQPEFVGQ